MEQLVLALTMAVTAEGLVEYGTSAAAAGLRVTESPNGYTADAGTAAAWAADCGAAAAGAAALGVAGFRKRRKEGTE